MAGGMSEVVTFTASFPPIMSAIRAGNDGWRIQLDIPVTEVGNAAGLLAYMGQAFRVTIAPEPDGVLTSLNDGEATARSQTHQRPARRPFDVAGGGL
jgi:hypothetical protein